MAGRSDTTVTIPAENAAVLAAVSLAWSNQQGEPADSPFRTAIAETFQAVADEWGFTVEELKVVILAAFAVKAQAEDGGA